MAKRYYSNNSSHINSNQFPAERVGGVGGQNNYGYQFSVPPPQIQHNVNLPQMRFNVPPPQIQYNMSPPQIQYNVPPPHIQYNVPPPQVHGVSSGSNHNRDFHVGFNRNANESNVAFNCDNTGGTHCDVQTDNSINVINSNVGGSHYNKFSKNPYSSVTSNPNVSNIVENRNTLSLSPYCNSERENISIDSNSKTQTSVNSFQPDSSSSYGNTLPNVMTKKEKINFQRSSCHFTSNGGSAVASSLSVKNPNFSKVTLKSNCVASSNTQVLQKSSNIKNERINLQSSCNFANEKSKATTHIDSQYDNQITAFLEKNKNHLSSHKFFQSNHQNSGTNRKLKQEHLVDCSHSGSLNSNLNYIEHYNVDSLRGPLDIDLPEEELFAVSTDNENLINGPLDIDLPAEEVHAFLLKERNKQHSNSVNDVTNHQLPAVFESLVQRHSIDDTSSFRLSPVSSIQSGGCLIQNGESSIDEFTPNSFQQDDLNCNNVTYSDFFENSSTISANSEISGLDVNRYQHGVQLNLFSSSSRQCSSNSIPSNSQIGSSETLEIGFRREIICSTPFDSGKEVYDRSRVDNSPERKYLHLIRGRLPSRSPERLFLERINGSKQRRSRSSSVESYESHCVSFSKSNDSRRNRRSRSVSQERSTTCSRNPKRSSRSWSRSPVRLNNNLRSRSPRKQHDDRFHSKSPERSYNSHKKICWSRSRSKSPSSAKYSYFSSKFSRNQNRDASPSKVNKQSKYTSSRERDESLDRKRCRYGDDDKSIKSSTKSSSAVVSDKKMQYTEREELLLKYRKDFCSDVNEMRHKLNELSKLDVEEIMKKESQFWTRMSPSNLYYQKSEIPNVLQGTPKLEKLCDEFENVLVKRAGRVRAVQPKYDPPVRKKRMRVAKHKSELSSSSSSSSSDSDHDLISDEEDITMEELERKRNHPFRLHPELWFNDVGEMNDGPLCRCSAKARRSGIRHNIYAGELNLPKCEIDKNNANNLYHYRITISPPTNFLIKTPTIIPHDDHEFIFEGFSMFSHIRLNKLPVCKVIRFNIEYTILYFEEKMPENFTIRELDLFYEYLFKEILELVDLDFRAGGDKSRCSQFHFMPRFVRELPDNGKEILSMNEVLLYLLKNSDDLIKEDELQSILNLPQYEWQKKVDLVKGMVVTIPGMKPCSLRVDQLDRDKEEGKTSLYPEIVHFGIRPPQLSYAGNPEYQKAWREYVKFRHLLANMPKPSFEDKRKLEVKENKLQEMRTQSKMKRDVTVTVNSNGFKKTGIMCDIVQHAMLIPVLVSHLRFHCSLGVLEETVNYKFENRFLLQLALTHPSYRENFGTNPDHARNSLTNCGIRQPEYGDRRIHYMNTRKRGINTLINIMSRFGKKTETESNITHNERLEFLGDAVVEFITSIHLFHMFPDLEEGGLATYRAAIVQNQHLAVLAKTLKLDEFMLYAHGSDLCHDLELRHAMANCFEALMGALFLDGGIEVADKVFGETLFKDHQDIIDIWVNYPPHPLQEQEPLGDRKWIPKFELLQKLTKFEGSIGVEFNHIRLLARAFTDRSMGYTNLTLGSNQRLEFLGDTVLQLIASEYLYKFFPEHHEGHLSLLRSSLVNNRTQAVVCNDLGMQSYALYHNPKAELKTKDRADLLEAFLGALYVDKGLEYCEVFCNVCFFPRLQTFIMRQDWNDPKSKLQQCCLTLRTMEGGEPEIPIYKVIECMGPTNTRIYTVAVYFKGRRLAEASGHSIQQAEMNAAKKALQRSHGLFPQLDHQKRVIAKSLKTQPSNIHQAEVNPTKKALQRSRGVFPQFDRQKRFLGKNFKSQPNNSLQGEMNSKKKTFQRPRGLFPQFGHQNRIEAKSFKTQPNSCSQEEGFDGTNQQLPGKRLFFNKKTFSKGNDEFVRYDGNDVRMNNYQNDDVSRNGYNRKKCL